MQLTKRTVIRSLTVLALAASVSSQAFAGTYNTNETDPGTAITSTNNFGADIGASSAGAITVTGAITVEHDGVSPANANVITLDNGTSTNNHLEVLSGATIQSDGGSGVAVEVTAAGDTGLNAHDAGIYVDGTSSIVKTAGSAGAISTSADISIVNAGNIQLSGGTGLETINITGGTTSILNSGIISNTATGGTAVIRVGAAGTLSLTNTGNISSNDADVVVIDASASGATVSTLNLTGGLVQAASDAATAIDISGDTAANTIQIGTAGVEGKIILGGTNQDTVQFTGTPTIFDGAIIGDATVGGRIDVDADTTFSAVSAGQFENITEIDVASGQTLTFGNNSISNTATAVALTISGTGTTDITGANGNAFVLGSGGLTVNNGATLVGDSNDIIVGGPVTIAGTATGTVAVSNSLVTVSSGGTATSLYLASNASGTIINNGTIVSGAGTGNAIEAAGGAGTIINLTNSGTISSTASGHTLIDLTNANTTIGTFTNSGDLAAFSTSDAAINISGDTSSNTITLAGGTITGSIVLSSGTDTVNITSSTVSINGNISGDSSGGGILDVDTDYTHGGSSNTIQEITSIDLATGTTFTLGANSIDNDSSDLDLALSGSGTLDITGQTGTAINTAGATTGFTLGTSNTLVTDSAAVIAGNLVVNGTVSGTLVVSDSTVTINSGASVGAISGTSVGTETLLVKGAYSNNTLTGIDNITVSGTTFTVSDSITGLTGTITVNDSATFALGSNTVTNSSGALVIDGNGNLNLGTGTLTLGSLTSSGTGSTSATIFTTVSGTSIGQLVLASGGGDFSATALSIGTGTQIAEGSYTVVSATGSVVDFGTVTETTDNVLYSFTSSVSGTDIVVFVDRTGLNTLATNTQNSAVGSALETIVAGGGATSGTALATILDGLATLGQTGSGAVDTALSTLNPTVDGLGTAAVEGVGASFNTVGNRMSYLRHGGESGLATGDGTYSDNMWFEAYGASANQGERNGVAGFTATNYGFNFGFDSSDYLDHGVVGLAVGYSSADVDSKAASNAESEINTYNLAGYFSQDLANNMYFDGIVGVGYNQYETQRTITAGSTYTAYGDFSGFQLSGRGAIGQRIDMGGNFTVVPEASVQYSYLTMDEYTETGAGNAGLKVDVDGQSTLVLGLGGTAAWDFEHASGSVVRAELRGKYTFDALGDELTANSNFIGNSTTFKTEGAKVAQHGITLGTGLKLLDVSGVEVGLGYDATLKADYVNHSGNIRVRWAF